MIQVRTKVMVSMFALINIRPSSKKDPCGIFGNWMNGRWAKIKRRQMDLQRTLDVGNSKGVTETYNIRKKNCMMM